jgi:hypothetical protein
MAAPPFSRMLDGEPIPTTRRMAAAMFLIPLLIRLWKQFKGRKDQGGGGGRGSYPDGH